MTQRERFFELRRALIAKVNQIRAEGEPGKSYEGLFRISYTFPDASECWDGMINKPCEVTIELSCYLVGPNRHYSWTGKTFEEALSKCEKDVAEWLHNCA